MMKDVSDEHDFLSNVDTHLSVGTASGEWMNNTFVNKYREDLRETLHITANPSSDKELDPTNFLHLEEVWRDGWNEEYKTILPQTVTDRAIALHREFKPKKTIIHYMQPHTPFIPVPQVNSRWINDSKGKKLKELAEEHGDKKVWEFHIKNLNHVLDSVDLLLSNIEAEKVVISADHGQALGEDGVWNHPPGSHLRCLREVPWCVTTASDSGNYQPEWDISDSNNKYKTTKSVKNKLENLGYK